MKTFARSLLGLTLLVGSAGLTFAAGTQETYSLGLNYRAIADQTAIGSVEVPVNAAIRAWFQSQGIDGTKIDAPLATLDKEYKDSISDLMNDADVRAEVEALIKPALRSALVRGSIETATMRIGRHHWALSIDGPEDHND